MDSFEGARGRPESGEDPKINTVLYPPDRRPYFWMRPSLWVILILVALVPMAVAWLQYLIFGLPNVPASPQGLPEVAGTPHGFPVWLRVTHYVNFLFIILLARSGLSILADRPISGPTARSPRVMSGRDWRPTLSATTASSSTARW